MRVGLMRAQATTAYVVAFLLQLTVAWATLDAPPTISEADPVIKRIVECVQAGREALLLAADLPECKDYRAGKNFLPSEMPTELNVEETCPDPKDKPAHEEAKDSRKLSGDAIKRIVSLTKSVDPRGIRIFGAIFCEELDLTGLDLSYTLVIDRSLFNNGFEARNFHTQGDLSFDGSRVLGNGVVISRSRIDGTVFGQEAEIGRLRILDSEIKGSLLFRESTILKPAIFDTISLLGELSVRKGKLSYFVLQFSKVGAVLDLTESHAQCAYLVRKSEIGDLVAVQAGFGPSDQLNTDECGYQNITLYPPSFLVSDTRVKSSLCFHSFHWISRRPAELITNSIIFNDINVGASAFIDLAPWGTAKNHKSGEVREGNRKFEAIGIKTHSFIFNFKAGSEMFSLEDNEEWRLPGIEFEPYSLFFNFKTEAETFSSKRGTELREMSVGGIEFDHAYAVPDEGVPCSYHPRYYELPSQKEEFANRLESFARMRLPRFPEIVDWLDNNCLQTTQPLSAFVDAAKKAGDVTEATELQIAKATRELLVRMHRVVRTVVGAGLEKWLLGAEKNPSCQQATHPMREVSTPSTGSTTHEPASGMVFALSSSNTLNPAGGVVGSLSEGIGVILGVFNDAVAVLFGSALWALAGHGFRPQQVGWWVLGTILLAVAYLWFSARVVGFMPGTKDTVGDARRRIDRRQGVLPPIPTISNEIRPIFIEFLFDRMLPALHLREENYNVKAYYKRASKNSDPASVTHMMFFGRKISLVKADHVDVARLEKCLRLVKLAGIVFAAFLVAAINALFTH